MKTLLKPLHLSFVSRMGMYIVLVTPAASMLSTAVAQELGDAQTSSTWKRISEANSRVSASRTSWNAVFSTPEGQPMAKEQIEQQVQLAEEKARLAGEREADVKQTGKVARRGLEDRGKSLSLHTQLNFVRVGDTIRSEINAVEAKSRGIELYDGKNSVFLETMVNGVEYPPRGSLSRDVRAILSHSAPTWQVARFLTGISLSQDISPYNPTFTPKDTTVSEGTDNTFILEKRTDPEAGKVGVDHSALFRMTLSKAHLRPVSYEIIDLLDKRAKGGAAGRVDVSGYKRYADNIWFPSKIVVATLVFRCEYNLIKAEFNNSVDPLELRLPPQTSIGDSRFGSSAKAIRYQLKDGQIPTDAQVRKMLGIKEEKVIEGKTAEAQIEEPKRTASVSFAPALGLIFLSLGVILWSRSKKL